MGFRWTEHRKIAAQGVAATVASLVMFALTGWHAGVGVVFGMGLGVSLLMVLLCWKWGI